MESTINQHIAYVSPRGNHVTQEFLHLALTGAYAELRRISDDAGSTKGALTCTDLKRFRLALPPLSEQRAISASVDRQTGTLRESLSRIEAQIALIAEYRTRLIADVVTGNLHVREAAARLPEEHDEPEAGGDMMLEDDGTSEDAELDAEPEEVEG